MGYVDVTEREYLEFLKRHGGALRRDVVKFCDPPVETFIDSAWEYPDEFVCSATLVSDYEAEILEIPKRGIDGWWRIRCRIRDDWLDR